MSESIFDDATIDITCDCGKVTPQTIGWLRRNDQFVCDCGTLIRIQAGDFVKEMSRADKSIEDFRKTIDRINKEGKR